MKKQSEKAKIYKTLKPYTKHCKGNLVVVFLLRLVSLGLMVFQPFMFSYLLDRGLIAKNITVFIVCIAIILAIFITNKIVLAIMTWHTNKIINVMTLKIKRDAYRKLLNTKYREMQNFKISSIKMRLEDDIGGLGGFILSYKMDYIFYALLILAYGILVLVINPLLTLYLLPIIPIVFLINIWLGKKRAKCYKNQRIPMEESYSIAYQSIINWKEIKILGLEKQQAQTYKDKRYQIAKLNLKWIFYWGRGRAFEFFKSPIVSNVLIFMIGGIFVLNGQVTIGVLTMFIQYFVGLFNSINTISDREAELKTIAINHNRLKEILDLPQIESLPLKDLCFDSFALSNVSFAYSSEAKNVLTNVNLKLSKGEYLGVVGESGCGKSTLIKLLLHLYDVDKGEITYNQFNVKDIDSKELYKSIAVVMQDSFLFNLSIEDNLKIAKNNATFEDMKEACISAGIWDFIEILPQGLQTIVGERGARLSGGQRQRLNLVQALIREPSILLLDEATSSLDHKREKDILSFLRKKKGQFSIIMIAHRASSLLDADIIIKINKEGRLIETQVLK